MGKGRFRELIFEESKSRQKLKESDYGGGYPQAPNRMEADKEEKSQSMSAE